MDKFRIELNEDVEDIVRKVLRQFRKARETCLRAYKICGDIGPSTLESCMEEIKEREDVSKNDVQAVAKCIDYVRNYVTIPVAELKVQEDRSPDIGYAIFVVKKPTSGERSVAVRIGLYFDPHGDGRSRPAIMTIRMLDPAKDAENIVQLLQALKSNPKIIDVLIDTVQRIGNELAKEIKTTPRTGKRKIRAIEEEQEEETEEEQEMEQKQEAKEARKEQKVRKGRRGGSQEQVHGRVGGVEIRRASDLVEGGEEGESKGA